MFEKAPAGGGWTLRQALVVLLAAVATMCAWWSGFREDSGLALLGVILVVVAVAVFAWPALAYRDLMARPDPHPDPFAPVGLTWLSLKMAREVMLASAVAARDQWAVVSRAHLDRVRPGTAGVIVYDPASHRVVMIARGVTAFPIRPRPLADFGLKAPRPIHYLRPSEVLQARGVALTLRGAW
jgi:hypothetical protein